MSRNSNPLTSFTLLEDRLTALLARIDAAAGVLTEQAARELSAAQNARGEAAGGADSAALDQLRQLTDLLERQESTTRDVEESPAEWLVSLQAQLQRIEQRVEELRSKDGGAATFS